MLLVACMHFAYFLDVWWTKSCSHAFPLNLEHKLSCFCLLIVHIMSFQLRIHNILCTVHCCLQRPRHLPHTAASPRRKSRRFLALQCQDLPPIGTTQLASLLTPVSLGGARSAGQAGVRYDGLAYMRTTKQAEPSSRTVSSSVQAKLLRLRISCTGLATAARHRQLRWVYPPACAWSCSHVSRC